METLIIATRNVGKVQEIQAFLAPFGIKVQSLLDYPDAPEVQETGKTLEENAELKAQQLSMYFKKPVLADDSGLMIDALDGAPGVYSARYAGDHDDEANKKKVLTQLEGVPEVQRTAHFATVMVGWKPTGEKIVAHGQVDGTILLQERGENGFGYDPLFYYVPLQKSFAELSMNEKNKISHRGRALTDLYDQFLTWWEA
ncbi:XTP/dITP diphosphatase [Weissella kandleri]|uniref:XTP/dITP diphosphatase n=1 Tax=Weissella kandleri TaxID=1616 RepID=UPI00387EDE41